MCFFVVSPASREPCLVCQGRILPAQCSMSLIIALEVQLIMCSNLSIKEDYRLRTILSDECFVCYVRNIIMLLQASPLLIGVLLLFIFFNKMIYLHDWFQISEEFCVSSLPGENGERYGWCDGPGGQCWNEGGGDNGALRKGNHNESLTAACLVSYIHIRSFSRRFYPKQQAVHNRYTLPLVLGALIEPLTLVVLALCSSSYSSYSWATGSNINMCPSRLVLIVSEDENEKRQILDRIEKNSLLCKGLQTPPLLTAMCSSCGVWEGGIDGGVLSSTLSSPLLSSSNPHPAP